MKKKKEVFVYPTIDIPEGKIEIDYKGWKIGGAFMADNKEACVIISNKKLKISHRVIRKCHRNEIHWFRRKGGIFNFKEVEEVKVKYNEGETIEDLVNEAKHIVDMYEIMKDQILKETQIKEVAYGFEKINFIKKDF